MIGFVGLSHLGIVSGAAAAAKGFKVLGVDPDAALVARLGRKDLPILETGLPEIYRDHGSNLSFSSSFSDLAKCSTVYISRDVPTDAANNSDLTVVSALIESVIPHLSNGATLVILCQVPPGFTRELCGRVAAARPTAGIKVLYQVETLIFGEAVHRALHPERIMIGLQDPAEPFPDEYGRLLASFECPLLPMRYESAELAKIAINSFLVSTVSTTNTLSALCEKIGADWSEIEESLRLDKRIGRYAYLKPGLGIAGGNLERDIATLVRLSRRHGLDSALLETWQRNSAERMDWAFDKLHELGLTQRKNPVIALWGLAYKPGTHSLKNAPSLRLIKNLSGLAIKAFDPEVKLPDDPSLAHARQVDSPEKAIENADALVVMTPWEHFKGKSVAEALGHMRDGFVIDPFGALAGDPGAKTNKRYITMGRS